MFIETTPSSFLEFDYLPEQISTTNLRIRNMHSTSIVFKIRTTAPTNYVVRPSSGFLSVGESKDIVVTINPKGELQDYQKHKFAINSVPAPSNISTIDQLNNFWASKPEGVKEVRLSVKCNDSAQFKSSSVYSSVLSEGKMDKGESIKLEIKDLKEYHEKQEVVKKRLQDEYKEILDQLKSRDDEINKFEEEALKGFGTVHLVLACLLGILVGYIYGIIKG